MTSLPLERLHMQEDNKQPNKKKDEPWRKKEPKETGPQCLLHLPTQNENKEHEKPSSFPYRRRRTRRLPQVCGLLLVPLLVLTQFYPRIPFQNFLASYDYPYSLRQVNEKISCTTRKFFQLCGLLLVLVFVSTQFDVSIFGASDWTSYDYPYSLRQVNEETRLSHTVLQSHENLNVSRDVSKLSTEGSPRDDEGSNTSTPVNVSSTWISHSVVDAARHRRESDGISACLVFLDDNSFLIEWLAYHYVFLPLKHLVIAVDDFQNKTSPREILDRWTSRIDIVEWTNKDFYNGPSNLDAHQLLVRRQKQFFHRCSEHHRHFNRTWVLMTDVDEFLTFNNVMDNDPKRTNRNFKNQAGKVDSDAWRENMLVARKQLPQPSDVGKLTLWDVMRGNRDKQPWSNEACITFPRLVFSSVPEPSLSLLDRSRSMRLLGLNATQFNTLRFFRHAEKGGHTFNRWTKVIVDVSRIPQGSLKYVSNPHRPFRRYCRHGFVAYETSLLRANHYTGSFEEFMFKGDARRSPESFVNKGGYVNRGVLLDMQPWLEAFVQKVGGPEDANALLDGIGQFSRWKVDGRSGSRDADDDNEQIQENTTVMS